MAASVDWLTKIVTIPQSDLTPVGPDQYTLNTDTLRALLHAVEWTAGEGVPHLRIHLHRDPYTMSGVDYADAVEIINGYTILFERQITDPFYQVIMEGGNTNVGDVQIRNGVSVTTNNSAGKSSTDGAQELDRTHHGFR